MAHPEKAKESRKAKGKSYEDYPWTELCEDVTKFKKLRVPELNKYLNHHGPKQHLKSSKTYWAVIRKNDFFNAGGGGGGGKKEERVF